MTAFGLKIFLRFAVIVFACGAVRADISLPPQFSDGMILQRGAKNRIWGGRTPNETIWYEYLPGDGRKVVDRASSRGKEMWEIAIDVPDSLGRSGNQAQLIIWEGKKGNPPATARTIDNIVFGDIWIIAVPSGEGLIVAPPALGARFLQIPEGAALNQWDNAYKWTATPARLQALTIKTAQFLASSSDRNGIPFGIIETSTSGLEDWLRLGGRLHRNPADMAMVKAVRLDANKSLDATNSIIRECRIELKHRGLVPKNKGQFLELETDRGVVVSPLQFSYTRYLEYETVVRDDFKTDQGLAHWLAFQAVIHAPLGRPK